jgi:hypothetical protein
MKIIGFEEHYGLPAIYEAAKKANDPYLQVLETLKKSGTLLRRFENRVPSRHL